MAAISIVGPQGGENVDLGSTKMRVLEDGTTTEQRLGIAVSTLAPHTDGPVQHSHVKHDEGFYIISGTARFTSAGDVHDAVAGSLVMVPPGVPHTFANPGDEPVVMLSTFTPSAYVQYFRDVAGLLAAGGPMAPEAMRQIMARYSTEVFRGAPHADHPSRTGSTGGARTPTSQGPA